MTIVFEGFGGVALAANVRGRWNGPPVVLVGDAATCPVWEPTAALLAERGFLAITLGSRAVGSAAMEFGAHVADLRLVVDQIGGRAALVTTSPGDVVITVAAAEGRAGATTALVLVDPHAVGTSMVSAYGPAADPHRVEWAAGLVRSPAVTISDGKRARDTSAVVSLAADHIDVSSTGGGSSRGGRVAHAVVGFLERVAPCHIQSRELSSRDWSCQPRPSSYRHTYSPEEHPR